MSQDNNVLLDVRDLRTHFFTEEGVARSVDGVSWSLKRGQTLALVGESGCGKSVTALSIMRLVPEPPGRIVGGQILFEGKDLVQASERELRQVRGNKIGMIFQEPMTSLNPVYTIGAQIVEAIEIHQKLRGREAWDLAVDMLRQVGIPAPARRAAEYPHQMSGGMRQRVMIAIALSCNPSLLIADEPTTALDVTIQAQILDLLHSLKEQRNMSVLLITHDLGVVAQVADEVCVMYASHIVERAGVKELFANPLHPYTQGLFRSIPRLGETKERLDVIPGNVPNPLYFPAGCKFHPRCVIGVGCEQCRLQDPPLLEVKPGHWAACWKSEGYSAKWAGADRREPAPEARR
jgi:oligopeptide/dipeptide ABC transporter ATP-binding protein